MGFIRNFKHYKRLVFILIILFFVAFVLSRGHIFKRDDLEYGVTFSHKQARSLGLDWQETYLAMLDDLGVRNLRLSAYWDEIEANKDSYDFSYLDYQLAEAGKRDAKVILALGGRVPRWPECHLPSWSDEMSTADREARLLMYIRAVVERYKNDKSVAYWQVENEPFLPGFGECPEFDKDFLDKEIELVRSMDNRPIVLTDSGELSLWVPAAKRADVFGTTMYLDTYSEKLKTYVHYPIEPGFFRFKKNIAKLFSNPNKWIVIELQAEPWGPIPFQDLSEEERSRTMDLDKFKNVIDFSSKTGFREIYLWGVEWWYWEKKINDEGEIWEEAKKLYK